MVLEAVRADIVAEIMASFHMILQIKVIEGLLACPEEVVYDLHSRLGIHIRYLRTYPVEMSREICPYTGKVQPCVFDRLSVHRDGHITVLDYGVGTCGMSIHHIVHFFSVRVMLVITHRYQRVPFKIKSVQPAVIQQNLSDRAGIQ